jgi:hypothetical protein
MAFFQWALAEWIVKALYKDAALPTDKDAALPTDKDAQRPTFEAFDKDAQRPTDKDA